MPDESIYMDDEDEAIMDRVWAKAEEEAKKRGVEGAGNPPKRATGVSNVRKGKPGDGEDAPPRDSSS